MTIKKFVLTATAVATVFAFTVPVSFASGCTTGGACPLDSVMTPSTATCNKCKMPQDTCKCKKKKEKKKKCDPCTTGAAAPCEKCKKVDCGCDPCKKDPCDPCKTKKSSCNKCKTGLGSSCMDEKIHTNMQVYAYPGAVYSPANVAVAGQSTNNNVISDANAAQTCPRVPGVYIADQCMTGAAAPIIDEALLPPKSDCCPDGSVQSPNSMTAIYKDMEPACNTGCSTGGACKVGGPGYPDVSDNYWASADIGRLTDQCVVVGYPDDLFKPNRPITRAEMAAMVVKGYNLDGTCVTKAGEFKDVPRSHWAHDFINKSVSADMLAGNPGNKFLPNNHLSRTEALTILSKGLKCPMDNCKADEILGKYKDGQQVPNWAKESVAKALDVGALKDSTDCDLIRPNAKATRAEISTMLQNVRIAGGYDTNPVAKTAIGPSLPTFVEKETPVCIPTLNLTMKDQINAKNANVGEMFAAQTDHEITINGVTYPCGSRVNGRITEVVRPSKCNEGAIKLSFTEIVGCDGCKQLLPKQVLTAKVEKCKDVNPVARLVEAPFTFVGSTLGNVGRTVGGMIIGLGNASEGMLDQVGTGTGEIFQGQFKAAGRSYIDGVKTTVKAPVDFTRTALMGTAGLFNNTVDEVAYLIDGSGNRIARVNPNEKMTIAFGNK